MAGMNMDDMGMMSPPPSPGPMTNSSGMMHGHQMMHMTFFWGKNAEILFPNWPGYDHLGMYLFALVVIFLLALIVEFLSHCKLIKENTDDVVAGILETVIYGLKISLAYIVMLAVMSFNIGVFLVAIAGHALGFLLFSGRIFKKPAPEELSKRSDLPLMGCGC